MKIERVGKVLLEETDNGVFFKWDNNDEWRFTPMGMDKAIEYFKNREDNQKKA